MYESETPGCKLQEQPETGRGDRLQDPKRKVDLMSECAQKGLEILQSIEYIIKEETTMLAVCVAQSKKS